MRVDVLRNAGDTLLTKTFTDDGTQVDAGAVTVEVTRADGTVLTPAPTVVKSGTGATTSYAATLDGVWLTLLDRLTVEWTRGDTGGILTDTVDVFGGYLFSLADMRAFDDGEYVSATAYPNSDIGDERLAVTDLLETWTGQSWIPRFAQVRLSGDGSDELSVPHHHVNEVISGWIDDVAMTAEEIADVIIDGRILARDIGYWPAGRRNIRLHYEYGRTFLVDGVDRVALIVAASRLAASNVEYDTETLSDDGATVRYTDEIPELRRWLKDHDWRSKSRSVALR